MAWSDWWPLRRTIIIYIVAAYNYLEWIHQHPEDKLCFLCRYINAATSPKDLVILIDSSGSMTGLRREIAKATVEKIVETIGDDDYFNVIKVRTSCHYVITWSFRNVDTWSELYMDPHLGYRTRSMGPNDPIRGSIWHDPRVHTTWPASSHDPTCGCTQPRIYPTRPRVHLTLPTGPNDPRTMSWYHLIIIL